MMDTTNSVVTGAKIFLVAVQKVIEARKVTSWSSEDIRNTCRYLWYNDFNLRKTFNDALVPGSKRGQEATLIPPWNENIVPEEPIPEEFVNAAEARIKSNRQSETNPWGLTDFSTVVPHKRKRSDVDEEGDGVDIEIECSSSVKARKMFGVDRDIKGSGDTQEIRALADRLRASECARRDLEDQYWIVQQKLERERHERQTEIEQTVDAYPYTFWPDIPWESSPEDIDEIQAPTEWMRHNAAPQKLRNETAAAFKKRENAWKQQKAEKDKAWLKTRPFLDSEDTEEEHTWHGVKFLGQGSFGCAGLWIKVDASNTIRDRMAVKECAPSPTLWKDPDEWRGKLPREVRIHQLVDSTRSEDSHRNLVQHRGYRLMMQKKRYRLYLDLCSDGELFDALIDRFATDPNRYKATKDALKPLPEPFVWHLFEGLVNACLILEQGGLEEKVEGWRPLVHNDLHICNVLLDKDETSELAQWPRVVVADYGRSFYDLNAERTDFEIDQNDNPLLYRIPSDNGRYPPETQESAWDNTRITSKSDVWQIGQIMWSILSHNVRNHRGPILDSGMDVLVNSGPFDAATELLTGRLYPVVKTYSKTLVNLVRRCLEYRPDDRATLQELKQSIDQNLKLMEAEGRRRINPGLTGTDQFSKYSAGRKHRKSHAKLFSQRMLAQR